MKILISNDDGINAKGIFELAEALSSIADIVIVAPKTEQSAVGHAVTMKTPLRIEQIKLNNRFDAFVVNGTPADCVKIGIRNILSSPPDLVVSGINHGGNLAINIIYSGTVSAAREAAIMGIPAIAFSITSHHPIYFEAARKYAEQIAKVVLSNKLKKGTLLNVNIPHLPENEVKGLKFTRQGNSTWDDKYEERIDPYGDKYYWLTGVMKNTNITTNSDEEAISQNYVSVTPIQFNLTDLDELEKVKHWF